MRQLRESVEKLIVGLPKSAPLAVINTTDGSLAISRTSRKAGIRAGEPFVNSPLPTSPTPILKN